MKREEWGDQMRIAYGSDVGRKRAKIKIALNFKIDPNVVFVIWLWTRGYQGGEVASKWLFLILSIRLNKLSSIILRCQWLEEKLSCENQMIIERSKQYQDLEGMGTTVVCAMFFENKCRLPISRQSRYILHDQKLVQLTEDHSRQRAC